MDNKLKIKVNLGGRVYPLTVADTEEEEGVRKAAKRINDLVIKYENNYAVNDKQDVLAMCALQFASQLEVHDVKKNNQTSETIEKLDFLSKMIEDRLK